MNSAASLAALERFGGGVSGCCAIKKPGAAIQGRRDPARSRRRELRLGREPERHEPEKDAERNAARDQSASRSRSFSSTSLISSRPASSRYARASPRAVPPATQFAIGARASCGERNSRRARSSMRGAYKQPRTPRRIGFPGMRWSSCRLRYRTATPVEERDATGLHWTDRGGARAVRRRCTRDSARRGRRSRRRTSARRALRPGRPAGRASRGVRPR